MLHTSQNLCGSIAAKAGAESVCLVAPDQQPWRSMVSVPRLSLNPYEVPGCQEAHAPEERMVGGWPRYGSWRHRCLATCAGVLSLSRLRPGGAAPHPSGGAVTRARVRAEQRGYGPRRPRHLSVPSDRPRHRCGAPPRGGQGREPRLRTGLPVARPPDLAVLAEETHGQAARRPRNAARRVVRCGGASPEVASSSAE